MNLIEIREIDMSNQDLINNNRINILENAWNLISNKENPFFTLLDLENVSNLDNNHSIHYYLSGLLKNNNFIRIEATYKDATGSMTGNNYWTHRSKYMEAKVVIKNNLKEIKKVIQKQKRQNKKKIKNLDK
jgi:hypothetical protein